MLIAETRIFPLGKYIIRQQPLPLNPAFATHLIYLAGKLIGKQLSVPTVSDCDWHCSHHGCYAEPEEFWQPKDFRSRGHAVAKRKHEEKLKRGA